MSSIFDQIRQSCTEVAVQSSLVKINHSKLKTYACSLPLDLARNPELDADSHYLGKREDTLAFFLILDSINFGSGYFPHLNKVQGKSGYFTIAGRLNQWFRDQGVMNARQLVEITSEKCMEIFNQDPSNEIINELMRLFARAMRELGMLLLKSYSGKFTALIEDASHSAEKLVSILSQMTLYNDIHTYRGKRVPLMKRAQLLAADLSLAFNGTGFGSFNDLSELTIFADNLVPHVLRIDKILSYEASLIELIDGGELIEPGSEMEIEIRACALHAVEMMIEFLREEYPDITAMDLDYLLWNRGQQPYYKKIRPRHRCRTVFY